MALGINNWIKSSMSQNGDCVEAGVWLKSSASGGGECVEIGAWNKSSRSITGNCVETTASGHVVLVRDTKASKVIGDDAPVLEFSLVDWDLLQSRFKEIAKAAEQGKTLTIKLSDGSVFTQTPSKVGFVWTKTDSDVVLDYTPAEIKAWAEGARVRTQPRAPARTKNPTPRARLSLKINPFRMVGAYLL